LVRRKRRDTLFVQPPSELAGPLPTPLSIGLQPSIDEGLLIGIPAT